MEDDDCSAEDEELDECDAISSPQIPQSFSRSAANSAKTASKADRGITGNPLVDLASCQHLRGYWPADSEQDVQQSKAILRLTCAAEQISTGLQFSMNDCDCGV